MSQASGRRGYPNGGIVLWFCRKGALDGMRSDGVITLLLRAGMMASRLYHRERVIPALTDHLVDEAG